MNLWMTKHFFLHPISVAECSFGWRRRRNLMRIHEKREAVSNLMMTVRRPSKAEIWEMNGAQDESSDKPSIIHREQESVKLRGWFFSFSFLNLVLTRNAESLKKSFYNKFVNTARDGKQFSYIYLKRVTSDKRGKKLISHFYIFIGWMANAQ